MTWHLIFLAAFVTIIFQLESLRRQLSRRDER
jgi:hypothetical protein